MKKIAIFGAGGFGREVDFLIQHINDIQPEYQLIGYFDDGVEKGKLLNNVPVLGDLNDLNNWEEELYIAIAIGNPLIKEKVINRIINPKIIFPTLIHPDVLIGDMTYNSIGEGSIICAGNIITVNTEIGKHVILNLSCTVGHDARIGDYCSIMPSVNVSGEVVLEKGVYVGTGAKINNQLTVGKIVL